MRDFDKDFLSWYQEQEFKVANWEKETFYPYPVFDNLPFSWQWGVYQDFFDEKGIRIFIGDNGNQFCWKIYEWRDYQDGTGLHLKSHYDEVISITRQEARQSSINKAKEIYENK